MASFVARLSQCKQPLCASAAGRSAGAVRGVPLDTFCNKRFSGGGRGAGRGTNWQIQKGGI